MARRREWKSSDYVTFPIKLLVIPFLIAYQTIDDKIGNPIRTFIEKKTLPKRYRESLEKYGLNSGANMNFCEWYSQKYPDLEEKLRKIRQDYI